MAGNEWDPEIWNGGLWGDTLKNLESPDSSELFRPAEAVHSFLLKAGIPLLLEHDVPACGSLRICPAFLPAGCQTNNLVISNVTWLEKGWTCSGRRGIVSWRCCRHVVEPERSSISLVHERPIDWNWECECGWWVDLPHEAMMPALVNWQEHLHNHPVNLGNLDSLAYQITHLEYVSLQLYSSSLEVLLEWTLMKPLAQMT